MSLYCVSKYNEMENIKKTIEHLYKDLGQNISDDAQIFETIIETKHQVTE